MDPVQTSRPADAMHAHIFDIDGTLIDSNHVDGELFIKAVRLHVSDCTVRHDWGDYTHVTDSGILEELLRDNSTDHTPELASAVRTSFVKLMEDHLSNHGPFPVIAGSRVFLDSLRRTPNAAVAYATGGWRETAQLKLEAAGFPTSGIPLASGSDHHDRIEIMRLAVDRLGGEFESVTYYGDAPWDRVCADGLNWNFMGVGARINGINDYTHLAALRYGGKQP